MGKTVCSGAISRDTRIPGTIVRTSTIPEELGRIHYLLSDKTGTLTKNDMELKKIHLGTVSFAHDSLPELREHIHTIVSKAKENSQFAVGSSGQAPLRGRRDITARLFDVTMALAVCHNVTPVEDADQVRTYQAASPDEIAIVKWTEIVGMTLVKRDRESIVVSILDGLQEHHYEVLYLFPFTSETKRMGIIVRNKTSNDITFYEKGADVVMSKIVQTNDWLEEECDNFAREGLRTLVIARKRLTVKEFEHFQQQFKEAQIAMQDRSVKMASVIGKLLEQDMELLGVTGVEDKLQDDVRLTLETLRNAGVKVWMLTGDKVETACCIALSSRLVTRSQPIVQAQRIMSIEQGEQIMSQLTSRPDGALVIDGGSLQFMMDNFMERFALITTGLSAVICCRCTPTQKADVARMLQKYTGQRVACIGDGGNDVSMIQAANVGIGIVGKEGRQASLAADFSITQFCHLSRLLLWHGRNSYKRTAKVSQFVIHRGFIIATMQAVFSALFYLSPIALYQGLIAIGYTTVYTMFPVFSLVLDTDITEEMAILYPELYKELLKGREVTFKTFFKWLMISTYQGVSIMMLAMVLFESHFIHIVMITFTALVVNEWAMVAVETTRWHWLMAVATLSSMTIYGISIVILRDDFDARFAASWPFVWKVAVMTMTSFLPFLGFKVVKRVYAPPSYTKLR
jgi:phospholipid-translocating ATPase